MKKYHLRVLYPSTNESAFNNKQSFDVIIEASTLEASEAGCYKFYDKKGLVAAYPIKFTIIEKVV